MSSTRVTRAACLCATAVTALGLSLLRPAHASAAAPAPLPQPLPPTLPPPPPTPSRRISTALARYPNLSVLYQSRAVMALFTTMRAAATGHADFSAAADRLMRILAEEGLAEVRGCRHVTVATPCGAFDGLVLPTGEELAVVSIVRAGDALQEAVRKIAPSAALGKILIQRDEEQPSKPPRLYFVKLPPSTHLRKVVLVDPMLATGQSAIMAIGELLKRGVLEENIGLEALFRAHPGVKVFTGAVDVGLNENRYIVPGLGDYGDRYYGTQPLKHG